jgi:ribosomal protein S18 acetylase RimI-like enzyme
LKHALALYKKLGFVEIPVDGPYKRSDIKMELPIMPSSRPSIEIFNATMADAAILCELGERTFRETFTAYNTVENMSLYVNKNFTVQKLEDELLDKNAFFFIAKYRGVSVGYIKMRTGFEPEGLQNKAFEIERLYVLKEYFGKSAGKKLIERAFEEGKGKGYEEVWLGVWEHNTKAIAFYEKIGFKKISEHTFMLGDDAQTDWLVKKYL